MCFPEKKVFPFWRSVVYSADTVSWTTTDSCRWCFLPTPHARHYQLLHGWAFLIRLVMCSSWNNKRLQVKQRKELGKRQWRRFSWNPWKDLRQRWRPTQGTPCLFSSSPWGFYLSFYLSFYLLIEMHWCCSGWWFVWNNRKVNCRSPWGRNWQMRWSTMLIQHPSQWIHMGPTFKLYLPLTLRQKLANEVTNSLPK